MNKEMLTNLLAYNIWANERITKAVLQAGNTAADMEQKSSFSSVRKTHEHIYNSGQVWQTRLKNELYSGHPEGGFPEKLTDLCKLLMDDGVAFRDLIQSMPQEVLQQKITYKNTKGIEFSNSIQDIVVHFVNHGSYHRGQLVTMLRNAGHTSFEQMDYIAYVRK